MLSEYGFWSLVSCKRFNFQLRWNILLAHAYGCWKSSSIARITSSTLFICEKKTIWNGSSSFFNRKRGMLSVDHLSLALEICLMNSFAIGLLQNAIKFSERLFGAHNQLSFSQMQFARCCHMPLNANDIEEFSRSCQWHETYFLAYFAFSIPFICKFANFSVLRMCRSGMNGGKIAVKLRLFLLLRIGAAQTASLHSNNWPIWFHLKCGKSVWSICDADKALARIVYSVN